jgi:hypothetical protein
MGWCHAFGPQIRAGCDHAMVAGRESCSCAHCGAVCHGLFSGCANVWAAGPREITLTRPHSTRESPTSTGTPLAPLPATTSAQELAPAQLAVDNLDMRALRVDMQMLMWKVDRLHGGEHPGDQVLQAAQEITAATSALTQQVTDAVARALEAQRRETIELFADMERRILGDIEELLVTLRPVRPEPDGGAVSVADLDDRFQWLVDAVSERFVTLGNGLARVERAVSEEPDPEPAPTSNRSSPTVTLRPAPLRNEARA